MKNWRLFHKAGTNQARVRATTLAHFLWNLTSVIALSLLLNGFSLHAATLPAGFTETQVGSNLSGTPTAMDFSPDGRLFVCLQEGRLRVIENGVLLATPFVTVTTTANGERGLLGIAFDPNFASNQFIYVYYTVITAPIHNRVSRFTANGNVAVTGSETVILELDNLSSATNHNGGGIHFGPDGKLYAGVGENANPANAQSINNRLGKLLRINADGTIPPDNPTSFPGIAGSPSGVNRAIWAVGLRNPFTFAFQPGTGRLFINDVGQSAWEEINDGIVGSNYGWSLCEGACSPPNSNFRDPLFQYDHTIGSTGGCAIVGGAFYNPAINQFPASYTGKYFFSDLCSGWIRLMDPSDNTASAFATGINSPVDLKVHSTGSLYYLAQGNSGQVFKIQYPLSTPTPTPTPAQAVNISTRLRVETGDRVMIGGFIVTGTQAKKVAIRGIGPSLAGSGLSNLVADPTLQLRGSGGVLVMQNDNWQDDPAQAAELTTLGLGLQDARESGIVATLQPAAYTVIMAGKNQTSGIGLVEVYDADTTASSQLANISTRGFVQTGDNVMIGGFILGVNSANARVAVRGIGPSLTRFGLSGVLADPVLELRDHNGTLVVSNDNWTDDPLSAAQLMASGLALQDLHESGIFASLPPGAFTAILAGKNGGTGIALVEIYTVQ
jgi:glucose/arabinose dehydrogenase